MLKIPVKPPREGHNHKFSPLRDPVGTILSAAVVGLAAIPMIMTIGGEKSRGHPSYVFYNAVVPQSWKDDRLTRYLILSYRMISTFICYVELSRNFALVLVLLISILKVNQVKFLRHLYKNWHMIMRTLRADTYIHLSV